MAKVVSKIDKRVVGIHGVYIAVFKAGQIREVPDFYVPALEDAGVTLVEQTTPETLPADDLVPETLPAEVNVPIERIPDIAEAILILMRSGDDTNFTASGDPRVTAIEELVGFNITTDERAQAMALIDDTETTDGV